MVWAEIGLVVICISWVFQLISKTEEKISERFVSLYLLGTIILAIEGFISKNYVLGVINFFCFLIAFWVLVKSGKKHLIIKIFGL